VAMYRKLTVTRESSRCYPIGSIKWCGEQEQEM